MKKKSQPYVTILVISTGFLLIYFLKDWKWAAWISLTAGIIGILSPFLARKINYLWMKLADILGWIMPKIILSIVFFVFLFPISLLALLLGRKDHLQLKVKSGSRSTYSSFSRTFNKVYFEKPW